VDGQNNLHSRSRQKLPPMQCRFGATVSGAKGGAEVTFSEAEPDSQDLKEIAAQRWKAVEAFLSLPIGLEARLGAKLVAAMNAQTRVCMPSEVRLIAELGCSRRGLQQAKASLRQQGLIDWQTPVGPRGGAMYQFNFEALELLHTENKTKGNEAVAEQRENNLASPYYTARRAFKAKANPSAPNSEPQCAINPGDNPVKAHSDALQSAFSDVPKRIFEQSIANPSAQDIAVNLTHRTLPFNHADHFAIGGDKGSPTIDGQQVRSKSPQGTTTTTLLQSRLTERHPKLIRLFASSSATINSDATLDAYDLTDAEGMVTGRGRAAVVSLLRKAGVSFPAEEESQTSATPYPSKDGEL
jgi:hypothetical protein